jgi:hypothetical protein
MPSAEMTNLPGQRLERTQDIIRQSRWRWYKNGLLYCGWIKAGGGHRSAVVRLSMCEIDLGLVVGDPLPLGFKPDRIIIRVGRLCISAGVGMDADGRKASRLQAWVSE